ncbi:hypothetical protein N0V82_006749 [Gnomoniopsis sp. IMI 355080]|nr:hypothetical protein N0V82_006749 [Gnomoniopsis sp. IMI 355080]
MNSQLVQIPAQHGSACRLRKGQTLRLINTHGTQVVDLWAFNADDLAEHMSMPHTRAVLSKIIPAAGDTLVTNRRTDILTIIADSSPGHHDTLIAACDEQRYRKQYGMQEYHRNCNDNLKEALQGIGEESFEFAPAPFNVWMNIPFSESGEILWKPATSKAGDQIDFRAEMDCIVAMSACPNDVAAINSGKCQDVHYGVL